MTKDEGRAIRYEIVYLGLGTEGTTRVMVRKMADQKDTFESRKRSKTKKRGWIEKGIPVHGAVALDERISVHVI